MKKRYLLIFAFALLKVSNAFAISGEVVQNDSSQTNQYGLYTISFNLANNGGAALDANVDTLYLTFDAAVGVPATIPNSSVTVNNTQPNNITVLDSVVKILIPVNVSKGQTVTIKIKTSALVQNPSVAAIYTLGIDTSGPSETAGSGTYTISTASSQVKNISVTPNPSVASENAAYSIAFTLGGSGQLTASDGHIIIHFPNDTYIPTGGISGVTVEGTPANATGAGDSISITTPVDLDNNSGVNVSFAIGSGLKNPSIDSTGYTMQVYTSSEFTQVESETYTISPAGQLSITSITTYPDTVNKNGELVLEFRTGSSGALSANTDSIFVVLPYNTYLPTDLSANKISVSSGGLSDDASAIVQYNGDNSDPDTIAVIPSLSVGNSSDVNLTIKSTSGLLSPSLNGSYALELRTTSENTYVTSNPYYIRSTNTTISSFSVTPSNKNPSTASAYTFDFNLGKYGRLIPGQSVISLTLNSSFTISEVLANYQNSTITIGGGTAVILDNSLINPNNTAKQIQITIPDSVTVLNNENVLIFLNGTSGPITNPAAGNYTVDINSSVEATTVTSTEYNIGGTQITSINSITLGNSDVNETSAYTLNITVNNNLLKNDNDYIKITFPDGTVIPASIATGNVTINGSNPKTVAINQGTRTATLTVNTNSSGTFDVVFVVGAGIINPIIPSTTFYKTTIHTSKDLDPLTSSAYTITEGNTTAVFDSVEVIPAVKNASNTRYDFYFTTSSTGKIAGGRPAGSSFIYFDFDPAVVVPASVNSSSVSVGGSPSDGVEVLTSGAGGKIKVTVPNGTIINNSTQTVVSIDTTGGFTNGDTTGYHPIYVYTSSDTIADSTTIYLESELNLTFNSISSNPTTQNASASYTIKFTPGTFGALSSGDSVIITFPDNTYVPATISKSNITIKGTQLAVTPSVSGRTMTITSPVSISAAEQATLLISGSSGILNPTTTGNYQVSLYTNKEGSAVQSPLYGITATSTTVSAADVSLANGLQNTATSYTVNFNIGNNGRLIAGSSTINIQFGSETGVSTTISNYDNSTISVNSGTGVSIASNISVSSKTVIVTIPGSVEILNNYNVEILLDGATTKPITNPLSTGSYSLDVKSSVETTYITSNSYSISNLGAVGVATPILSSTEANAIAENRILFQVDAGGGALTAGSGTISVYFPDNTSIPVSISTSNVEIRSGASLSGTTPHNPDAITTNATNRLVTLTVPTALGVANGDSVQVQFFSSSSIENPSVAGTGVYTLEVATSSQTQKALSPTYSITPSTTTITINEASFDKQTINTQSQFTMNITTGAQGRLKSGTSYIDLIFPIDVDFTLGTPPNTKVKINSTAANSVELFNGVAGDQDTLRAVVPTSVTIGNSTAFTIVIDSTAGLQTPPDYIARTYKAYTSVEPTIQGLDQSLPVELTTFSVETAAGKAVINWVTESELNNAYWIIEKFELRQDEYNLFQRGIWSLDKFAADFQKAGELEGKGTTPFRNEYLYIDSSVVVGHYYLYRLADISCNGDIQYHSPVAVEIAPPADFRLEQNYPNPFNPSTTIRFNLPEKALVSLIVYNVAGQEVIRILDRREMNAGAFSFQWKGNSMSGAQVASGMYFYRIQAGNFSAVRKMLLIR